MQECPLEQVVAEEHPRRNAAHPLAGEHQCSFSVAKDNEPALWQGTHRDIHPQRLGYDELWTKTEQRAAAVKAADPTAATLGPSDWGWCAYFFAPIDDPNDACATGPDRQAHGDVPLAEWYLAQARAYQQRTGVRLLDYFDEHYYPQANQVALNPAGDAATQALRLRTTRSL